MPGASAYGNLDAFGDQGRNQPEASTGRFRRTVKTVVIPKIHQTARAPGAQVRALPFRHFPSATTAIAGSAITSSRLQRAASAHRPCSMA